MELDGINSNEREDLHMVIAKAPISVVQDVNQSEELSCLISNQPSTSGVKYSSNSKTKDIPNIVKKRKADSSTPREALAKLKGITPEVKHRKRKHAIRSPPMTRNYTKLSSKELSDLGKRIFIYHENGIIPPEGQEDITPCRTKKGTRKRKYPSKRIGEQVPGTHLGKGNIGANCSKYGISKCRCCTSPTLAHVLTQDCVKTADSNIMSCAAFGINNCICCITDIPLNNNQDSDTINVDHLSVSQSQPIDNSDEYLDNEQLNGAVATAVLPTKPLSKQKLIEKFLDSFTHDRIDYSKPDQKNIVEGLIHNPVSYYSEHLCEDLEAPEKTILERIDFQKEQERLYRLTLLNFHASNTPVYPPLTPLQNPTTPGFKPLEVCETSTPLPTPISVPFESEVSQIEEDIHTNSPEIITTENIVFPSSGESNELVTSVVDIKNEITVKNEEIVTDYPFGDLSNIDRSFVTLRTPFKSCNPIVIENNMQGEEADIMDYVNNLIAMDEEEIVQECEMRCKRVLESQRTRHIALSAMDPIEIMDDDMLDNSVQIIESPIECLSDERSSDLSVQFVSDNRTSLCDSDIQIIEGPSTSKPRPHKVKTKKVHQLQPAAPSVFNLKQQTTEELLEDSQKSVRDCSICLEPLIQVKAISSTTCGHIFCTECIKGVIKTNKKCPICRSHLTLKKIHPLFLF